MHRMSVVICVAAVALSLAVAEGYASPARVAGLNLTEGRAAFTRDYVNTYAFPVAINRYPNMLWAELGHSGSGFYARERAMGLFHEIGDGGDYGVLGITLRQESLENDMWGLRQIGMDGVSYQQFDIMWGRDFERASVGFRFDLARSSAEDKGSGEIVAPYEEPIGIADRGYVNTWGVGGAVDYDLSEEAMLEVGGEVRQYTFRDDENEVEDDGSVSFKLAARVFYERSKSQTLVPLVSLSRTDIGSKGDAEVQDTVTDFMAGAACNHVVNHDDLLIYGAAFRVIDRERTQADVIEYDTKEWDLPILFLGLEHRFRDWLVGRGGASTAMANWSAGEEHSVESVANTNWLWADFDFALGIGLEFTNFTIDATLNQNYPFTGFWFVSGQSTPRDLFGQVSFTYTY